MGFVVGKIMSEDADIEAIRNKRLNDMQSQQRQSEEKQREMQEQKRVMLAQILTPDARERLSRILLVKPERAALVENHLIQAASSGQIRGKVDESTLRGMLNQVSTQESKTKVTYQRRRVFDSDDEEDEESDDSEEDEDDY